MSEFERNNRHPLDTDPDDAVFSSATGDAARHLVDSEQAAAQLMRRLSLTTLAVCAAINVVSGVIAVNVGPMSTFENSVLIVNRISMFGLLFGFIGLLLSFRVGLLQGWKRKTNLDGEQRMEPELDESPWQVSGGDQREALLRARSPLSLAFLFYLITLAAVLSACFQLLQGLEIPRTTYLTYCVAGIILGFVLGAAGGAFVTRRATAIVIGSMLGLPLGGVAGVLSLIDHQRFQTATVGVFASCALLVLCALLVARLQKPATIDLS